MERGGSPTEGDMAIESGEAGVTYEFLGWIQAKEVNSQENGGIVKGGAEWNYIYDVENDPYCTSDADKALPYLLKDDAVVTETMELYPVYVNMTSRRQRIFIRWQNFQTEFSIQMYRHMSW